MPNDGKKAELYFTELLESVISMSKAGFDRMIAQSELAKESGDFSGFEVALAASPDIGEPLQVRIYTSSIKRMIHICLGYLIIIYISVRRSSTSA